MPCDAYCERRLDSVTNLAIIVTFKSTTIVSAVSCSLYKADETTLAGSDPIDAAPGTFLNSSGGSGTDTVWTVGFEDFDPTTVGLVSDLYVMKFVATPSDGDDREVGKLCVRVTL